MRMSKIARRRMIDVMDRWESGEDFDTTGICFSCGELTEGVEPDAEEYECHDCNELVVFGIANAVLMM